MSSVKSSLYSLLPWGSHVGLWSHGCGSCVFVVFFGVLHLEMELLWEQNWCFSCCKSELPTKVEKDFPTCSYSCSPPLSSTNTHRQRQAIMARVDVTAS